MFALPAWAGVVIFFVFVACLISSGAKGLSEKPKIKPKTLLHEILGKSSPDGLSIISDAYYDPGTKKFYARVSCFTLNTHHWAITKTKEELKKEIDELFAWHYKECHSKIRI